jgi:lipopolysaccharide transport system permease protein
MVPLFGVAGARCPLFVALCFKARCILPSAELWKLRAGVHSSSAHAVPSLGPRLRIMVTGLLDNKYLIRELVARDVRSRYVGSLIGVFWSILNPLLQLLLYTAVFSMVLESRFPGPFWQYLFCALLPWMSIQESVTRSSRAFLENAILIKKVRFPLEVLPFSVVASAFVHQLLGTIVFVLVLVGNQSLNPEFFGFVFVLFAFQLLMAFGVSMVVACLNVFFRDIAQILGVLFMLLFWTTPMVYPKSIAPAPFSWLLNLNPLTHMVEAYRFVFFGQPSPSLIGIAYWLSASVAVYYLGKFVLRRTRNDLVDLI